MDSKTTIRYQDPSIAMTQDLQMDQAMLSHTFDRVIHHYDPPSTLTTARIIPWSPQPLCHLPAQEPAPPKTNLYSMSPQYLRMKQAQESQSLMENPTVNAVAIGALQEQQADERREMEKTRQMADQIQFHHADKYAHLKHMSPEMLNRAKGHPIPQSALPPYVSPSMSNERSSDVYCQTSYQYPNTQLKNHADREVKRQLEIRQREILSNKNRRGIQSYQPHSFSMGSSLEEAYQ